MLLPVFSCDGQDFHYPSSWATYSRSAPHVCGTLYDVWWQHSCFAENPGPSRHKNDYALCSLGT
ncbi:hypothetical protein QNN86_05550 [Citrobacter sp. C348]